jgi:hypothetical protein
MSIPPDCKPLESLELLDSYILGESKLYIAIRDYIARDINAGNLREMIVDVEDSLRLLLYIKRLLRESLISIDTAIVHNPFFLDIDITG